MEDLHLCSNMIISSTRSLIDSSSNRSENEELFNTTERRTVGLFLPAKIEAGKVANWPSMLVLILTYYMVLPSGGIRATYFAFIITMRKSDR